MPTPDPEIDEERCGNLTDRFGTIYPLLFCLCRTSRDWHVFQHGRRIGYALCLLQGEDFFLGDLQIESAISLPRSLWSRLLFRHPVVIDYRRRGLGSALLALVIAHARECGCRRVTGKVTQRDLTGYPDLAGWYRRNGFVYTSDPAGGNFVGSIQLSFD